jgi:predicted RecB family nuclease
MDEGALLVVGGRLPDDATGGRRGSPDVLLRTGTGYVPVLVKWHKGVSASARKAIEVSPLADPAGPRELAGVTPRTQRFDDVIELAHHTRLLQACVRHAGDDSLVGAVLGTDELDLGGGADLALVWHRLDEPRVTTFSRSRGTARRTALERYDHEHGFRVRVAEVARRRRGLPDDPEPLVVPVAQAECLTCPYQQVCEDELGPDDPSLALGVGRPTVREWLTLQALGVTTTADLAEIDPDGSADAELVEAYLAENAHDRHGALRRLRETCVRARMVRDGVVLERLGDDPLEVPRADVEIDLDYESDTANRVYLWGARVATRSSPDAPHEPPTYHPFVSWDALDDAGERELADALVTWLRALVDEADRAGRTLQVHHWTGVEADALRRVLGADAVADVLDRFVDLHDVVRRQLRGLHGLGLKAVAPHFGFGWRDEDAGGAQSQVWLQVARDPSDPACEAMRQRVLGYNQDDVEATAVVRQGLSELAAREEGLSPR